MPAFCVVEHLDVIEHITTGSLGGLNWNPRQAWVAGLNGLAESLKRRYVKGPLRVVARYRVADKELVAKCFTSPSRMLGRDRSRLNSACCAPISKRWIEPLLGQLQSVRQRAASDFPRRELSSVRLGASFSNHPKHALRFAPDVAMHWKWMELHGLANGRNDQPNSLPDDA